MKVGDLVRYKPEYRKIRGLFNGIGIITDTKGQDDDLTLLVRWNRKVQWRDSSILEVISESG